ncbi:MAG: hypothetical protein Q9214_003631 [Letrouitia sp. 1 TL-2023]
MGTKETETSRKKLEALCKKKRLNEDRADILYTVLKAVSTSDALFKDLSARIFKHADQRGRDTILRALGNSVDVQLEKLLCPDREEDANEIYQVMVRRSFEIQKAPSCISRAQDALFAGLDLPHPPTPEGSSTPELEECRIKKWIEDQSTLAPAPDKKRNRGSSDNGHDEYDSFRAAANLSETESLEKIRIRRPKRLCKGTMAAQGVAGRAKGTSAITKRQKQERISPRHEESISLYPAKHVGNRVATAVESTIISAQVSSVDDSG